MKIRFVNSIELLSRFEDALPTKPMFLHCTNELGNPRFLSVGMQRKTNTVHDATSRTGYHDEQGCAGNKPRSTDEEHAFGSTSHCQEMTDRPNSFKIKIQN